MQHQLNPQTRLKSAITIHTCEHNVSLNRLSIIFFSSGFSPRYHLLTVDLFTCGLYHAFSSSGFSGPTQSSQWYFYHSTTITIQFNQSKVKMYSNSISIFILINNIYKTVAGIIHKTHTR